MITALLIFFALVIEYIYDPISNMKDTAVIDNVFGKYIGFIKEYIKSKYYIYLLFPIFIMIIYSIIIFIIENYLHYFFVFIFNMVILVYCLKPSEFNQKIEGLKFSIDNNKDLERTERDEYILTRLKKDNDLEYLDNIFYNSTRCIFTVLFCFLLLGPSGCLAYIILDYFLYSSNIKLDKNSKRKIEKIISIIEFLPIRLCSFSFAVVGNFELCVSAWKDIKQQKELYHYNRLLVNIIGISSYKEDNGGSEINILLDRILYIQSIISRSLLAWLSLIGFLVITGIFI